MSYQAMELSQSIEGTTQSCTILFTVRCDLAERKLENYDFKKI